MTVNALQPSAKLLGQQRYTQNDLMVDPLIVLRCNRRVYRSEEVTLSLAAVTMAVLFPCIYLSSGELLLALFSLCKCFLLK